MKFLLFLVTMLLTGCTNPGEELVPAFFVFIIIGLAGMKLADIINALLYRCVR